MSSPRTPLRTSQQSNYGDLSSSPLNSSPFAPSSPLNPYSHKESLGQQTNRRPPTRNARRPSNSSRPVQPMNPTLFKESTYNALLREKMRAKCAARMTRDRQRAVRKASGSNPGHAGSSSDRDGSSDMEMDDDEAEDEVDDPLYQRVMASEIRKQIHRAEYSYQRQLGDSFDPDIEDLEEWEGGVRLFDEPDPSYDDDLDDEDVVALYESYIAELEENSVQGAMSIDVAQRDQVNASNHPSVSSDVTISRNYFLNSLLLSACPRCNNSSLQVAASSPDTIGCNSCQSIFPLQNIATSWASEHPSHNMYVFSCHQGRPCLTYL
ncbi:hypothetical protein FRC03_000030 [Tulasnella sp. 419]|nr:hypothetical protein FRC03_000030 [Tulasnella sp. 419]